ncbi:MAG: FKBP-type peptidyl-prolyl cis-trans isomerase [Prosthecobacter sp.]|nr:FKBP-type peptidyl-prolyl cis-trans isomerase [Prosthecobacter sp.]
MQNLSWHLSRDDKRSVRQIVINVPAGHAQASKFGILFFASQYQHLNERAWCTGYFRLDDEPGPFLMVRADGHAKLFRDCPLQIAFSFYHLPAGGLFGVFVSADRPQLRTASPSGLPVVEGLFGLDDGDSVKRISDALERDLVHLCFAGASNSTSVMFDERGQRIETSAPSCEFDRIAAVPPECRAALIQEFRELTDYHASLGRSNRDYPKIMEQLSSEFPPTEHPVLDEGFVVMKMAPPSPPPLPPSVPSGSGNAGAAPPSVKPARKSRMAGILAVAVLILLAVGIWPRAQEAWKSRGKKTVAAKQSNSGPSSSAGEVPKANKTPLPAKTAAQRNSDYLALNAKRKGVVTTASGLQYEVLKSAQGPKPKAEDTVKIYHHGILTDGNVFDSSLDRKDPVSLTLKEMIPGWSEGMQLMSPGAKYKFVIPSKLAYGEKGTPSIGPNETVVIEVELLEIQPPTPQVAMQPGSYQGSTPGIPKFSLTLVTAGQDVQASELGYEFAAYVSVGHAFLKNKLPFGASKNGKLVFQFRVLTSIQLPNLTTPSANVATANYQAEVTGEKDGGLKCVLTQIEALEPAYADLSFEEITFHFDESKPALLKNYTLALQSAAPKGESVPAVASTVKEPPAKMAGPAA